MSKITDLENRIRELANAYYSGNELVSDEEYDELLEELRVLDPENELIAGLAGDEKDTNSAGYVKMQHNLTTGTLSKAMTLEVFEKWIKSHKGPYHCSSKMDGAGCELQYENGKLVHLISRGNGYTGFDKIPLVKYLNIPSELSKPFTGSIRGEFELSNKGFKSHAIFADKKNPRNAGSGLLNLKVDDIKTEEIAAMKDIHFFAYDILTKDKTFQRKSEIFEYLTNLDFEVPVNITASSYDDIIQFREKMSKERGTENEQFAIDGIVVFEDVYDIEDQKEKIQKRAIAVKFDLMVSEGTILDIEWSISGSYLTPVAIMTPMQLNGTTVTRANLCNLSIINKLGVKIGDRIRVCKRGEIIPQILCKVS